MASIYSVSQVNAYIKNMFSQDFALNRISIKGEVSNCKYHTSGHIYFTLKDGLAAIQAVMFASRRKGLPFQMQDGQQVVVKGSVEVYERDGDISSMPSRLSFRAGICLSGSRLSGTSWKRWACLPENISVPSPCSPGRWGGDCQHRSRHP